MYQWKISALNIYGEGPLSDALSITPAAVADAPYDIVMVTSDSLHIAISWTEAYNGGNEVKTWNIYWDQGTDSWELSDPATLEYPNTVYTK